MKLGVLIWSPFLYCPSSPLSYTPCLQVQKQVCRFAVFAAVESIEATEEKPLSAKERRKLRNERREAKTTTNWREEVEERLSKKSKKQHVTLKAQRNLDHLAKLGPQWWMLRVSSVKRQQTVDILEHSIAKKFPDLDFNIYAPTVQVKTRLKNGSLSVKPKPRFSGCIFLRCILNKELHDFVRDQEVGGFFGFKIGSRKAQIKIPRPVSDMEAIFQRAKDEQEKADQEFEEKEKERMNAAITGTVSISDSAVLESLVKAKPGRRSKKSSDQHDGSSDRGKDNKLLTSGSIVRIISGNFAGFEGSLKKLNRRTKKATVVFTLLGKEILEDVDISELVLVTNKIQSEVCQSYPFIIIGQMVTIRLVAGCWYVLLL